MIPPEKFAPFVKIVKRRYTYMYVSTYVRMDGYMLRIYALHAWVYACLDGWMHVMHVCMFKRTCTCTCMCKWVSSFLYWWCLTKNCSVCSVFTVCVICYSQLILRKKKNDLPRTMDKISSRKATTNGNNSHEIRQRGIHEREREILTRMPI